MALHTLAPRAPQDAQGSAVASLAAMTGIFMDQPSCPVILARTTLHAALTQINEMRPLPPAGWGMPTVTDMQGARTLVVERPGREGLRVAYPLIRLVEPEVDLRSWLSFAAPLVRGRGTRHGVVTVRYSDQAHPCGICCFRRDRSLRHGEVLTADPLVALDLLDPVPLLSALLGELEVLAGRLGCRAIRIASAPRVAPDGAAWPVAGRLLLLPQPASGLGRMAAGPRRPQA
jgi:hypothetical protein